MNGNESLQPENDEWVIVEKDESELTEVTELKRVSLIPSASAQSYQNQRYDANYEKKLQDIVITLALNFENNESNWKQDINDTKNGMKTYHKMESNSRYCIVGVSSFNRQDPMKFYDYLSVRNHQSFIGWTDKDKYEDMTEIDDNHAFIHHIPSINGPLRMAVKPRDFCVIRTRFKRINHEYNHKTFDICGLLSYSVCDNHPWYKREDKKFVRCNVHYHSFLLIDCKDQIIQKNTKKLYFISNNDVKGSIPKCVIEAGISIAMLNHEINAYENLKQFIDSWDEKMEIVMNQNGS